jgi:hypothetical protein
MKHKHLPTTRLVIAVIALCSQFAYAADDSSKKSFEDGLSNSVYSVKDGEKETEQEAGDRNHAESTFESTQHREWKEFEDRVHVTMVPEPATNAMLLAGLAVLLVAARRKQVL